jgi:glycolate oxidase iron-sulfur subunit
MEKHTGSGILEPLTRAEDKLLACVHCGFCLSACPTYTRLGDEGDSPRGRLYLMRAVVEGRLAPDSDAFTSHIDRCLGCRACEPVCPSGVQYGFLLERARDVIAKASGTSLPTRMLLGTFSTRPLAALFNTASRLFRWTRVPRILVRFLPAWFGTARFGLAMLAATEPWRGLRSVSGTQPQTADPPKPHSAQSMRVAVLTGCVQEGLFARVNRATARVLASNGCQIVSVPAQRCCGALHAHSGQLEKARQLARANIEAFERSGAELVAVNAAGCGAVMKEYGELLEADPVWSARAHAFGARVRDVSELLVQLEPRTGAPVPLRITYDAPCHLHHAQRITRAPLDVLHAIPELEVVPLARADECCGGAGIYGLLHPGLGGHILNDKVDAIRATGAEVVITPNPGCMMQIGAGLLMARVDTRVLHPIELLDESYRRAGFYSGQ